MTGTALHPTDDLVWTGKVVFAFSSGTELVRVKDRQHDGRQLVLSVCPVWVSSNRVVEMAQKEESTVLCRWDAQEGKLLNAVDAPYAAWICVSPNGQHIAEAGSDKKVRIRNAETLEVEQELRVHEDSLTGVAWHPSLPLLVTASKDGTTRIWSLRDFKRVEELKRQPRNTTRLEDLYEVRIEITADGRELNLYRWGEISIFQPESFQASR
jgi:WD40 repeat protein